MTPNTTCERGLVHDLIHVRVAKSNQKRYLIISKTCWMLLTEAGTSFKKEKRNLSLRGRVRLGTWSIDAVKSINTKTTRLSFRKTEHENCKSQSKEINWTFQTQATDDGSPEKADSKDQTSLFGELFVSLQTRWGNLPLVFDYESAIPPSFHVDYQQQGWTLPLHYWGSSSEASGRREQWCPTFQLW